MLQEGEWEAYKQRKTHKKRMQVIVMQLVPYFSITISLVAATKVPSPCFLMPQKCLAIGLLLLLDYYCSWSDVKSDSHLICHLLFEVHFFRKQNMFCIISSLTCSNHEQAWDLKGNFVVIVVADDTFERSIAYLLIKSLAPGIFEWHSRSAIYKLILVPDG